MSNTVLLPPPQKELKFPLMKALEMRRTQRSWSTKCLSDQELSDVLWAACGITFEETRKGKSRRTAPSARNSQTISVYVAMDKGLFLYNEKKHALILVNETDIREHIGTQKMMKTAPVGLIYVSDYSKLKGYVGVNDNQKWFIAGTETGFISQNVYLYCASAELSTTVIGLVNRNNLNHIMGLKDSERVVYTQVVGKKIHPEKKQH